MIFLPHQKPFHLNQLEALIPRMSQKDPLYLKLKDILHREKSGYEGEVSLDYYYNLLNLDPYPTLHSLRLKNGDTYFQIDTLILFPNVFLIIEVKNTSGLLKYHTDTGLLVRENENGKLERFDDPQTQVKIQKLQFSTYLKKHNLTQNPIRTLVVFAHPNAILEISGLAPNLILPTKLMDQIPALQKKYKNSHVKHPELIALGEHLARAHTPKIKNIVKDFNISPSRIKNGVSCTSCQTDMMIRQKQNWRCPTCQHKDRFAHIPALQDFKRIYGPEITIQQACLFLCVTPRVANYLLHTAGCKKVGKTKGAKYIIP